MTLKIDRLVHDRGYPRFNPRPKSPVTLADGLRPYLRFLWDTRDEHSAFEAGYLAADYGPIYQH